MLYSREYQREWHFYIVYIIHEFVNFAYFHINVNESRYKQCGVTPHFPAGQDLSKKILRNINIDTINWEKFFDRSAEHK